MAWTPLHRSTLALQRNPPLGESLNPEDSTLTLGYDAAFEHGPPKSRRRQLMLGIVAVMILAAAGAIITALQAAAIGPFAPKVHDKPVLHASISTKIEVARLTTSDPSALKPISPEDALATNAAITVSHTPNPAASPLVVSATNPINLTRALDCMTSAVYYEAANEPVDGQRAVAQVILNRVRHPAYPHTVCGVVYEGSERRTGCQFTFTCDGSLTRLPSKSGWQRARAIALGALAGDVYAPVGWATHYHANYVVPYWASSLLKTAVVGAHLFYRWSGSSGQPLAFADRYAANEVVPGPDAQNALVLDGTAMPEHGAVTPPVERKALAQDASAARGQSPTIATMPVAGNRWILGSTAPAASASNAALAAGKVEIFAQGPAPR